MRSVFISQCFLIFVVLVSAAHGTQDLEVSQVPGDHPALTVFDRAPVAVFEAGQNSSLDERRARGKEVDFGVNGHPQVAGTYYDLPLEQQISLLKALGLKTYVVNVNPANPDKFDRLSRLITLAERESVRILQVIVIPASNYSDENAAYDGATSAVYPLLKRFDSRITVWELGNEYDLYCVKKGADGASPADYDPQKYAVVRGLIRGMLAALHEASPFARSMVETSQHTGTTLNSGFLEKLIEDGIHFDITGYHFYSRDGHIPSASDGEMALKVLHDDFRKPIWITEFDKSSSSPTVGPSADPRAQGIALRTALNEIAADAYKYDVIGADIYELLDQPELLKSPNVQPCQAQFGILNSHGGLTDASRAVREFLRAY